MPEESTEANDERPRGPSSSLCFRTISIKYVSLSFTSIMVLFFVVLFFVVLFFVVLFFVVRLDGRFVIFYGKVLYLFFFLCEINI